MDACERVQPVLRTATTMAVPAGAAASGCASTSGASDAAEEDEGAGATSGSEDNAKENMPQVTQ